jgi:aminopeptidase S
VVDVVAPDGSVYNVHNRAGGSADNIATTYTVNVSSEVANGTWRLRVRDAAAQDTGTINVWSLQF